MIYALKKALVTALRPLAAFSDLFAPLRRSSANAYLNNALGGTVYPSVGVLNRPELHGTRKITLGKNIYLHRNLYFEAQVSGCIKIGIDVVLSRGFHLVGFAGIGKYSSIRDANHRVITGSSVHYSGHLDKPVTIRRNAWIGRGGVTILGGVTIAEGTVIGGNAIVTKNVPVDAVAVGIPARVI